MRAPTLFVELSSGESVPLVSLYRDRTLALVFLRHFGCVFCRRQLSILRRFPELNIVFVGMGSPAEALAFRERYKVPHEIICDPQRRLYEAFGLPVGNLGQLLGPRVVVRAVGAMRYGQSRPTADPRQLGGVFVIDAEGEVVWSRRYRDASDNVRGEELARILDDASRSRPDPAVLR